MSNSAGPKITKDGLVLDFDAANPKSYNFYADSYASSVSLYLQMNGANGSTTFTDSSPNALTVTAAGNAQISTTQSKYNGSAGYFDGNGDTLTIPANAVFALGTGDYTIEGWFYSLTSGTSLRGMVDFRTATTGTNGLMLRENDAGFLVYLNSATLLSTTTGRVANQWQHVALVRQGTTVTLYVDGVSQTTATSSTNLTDNIMRISGFVDTQSSVYAYNGYIDNFKITKGVARYTSAFTSPPIPSTFTDLTRSKNVGTLTGGVDYNFSNGGVINFGGTPQYLAINGGMPSGASTGFTFECWVRVTDLASYRAITRTASGLDIGVDATTGVVACDQTGITRICSTSSGTIVAGVWTHIAVTRTTANLYTIYINGASRATGTNSFSVTAATTIGYSAFSTAHFFNGSMSIIKNYNRTLTSTEVYNNFVANRGRFGV